MKKIGLIGAGALGSRHLQAMALFEEPLSIEVIDTSTASLQMAKTHWDCVVPKANHTVRYLPSIEEMSNELDLVVIATSSLPRRKVIEELLNKKKVTYLILEKVAFPCIEDFQAMQTLFEKHNVSTWVNCASRYYPGYKTIQKDLQGHSFEYALSGGNFGLACNAVHFLDIICFLANDTDYELYGDMLDAGYIESKRKNYIEFTGTLYGKSKNCSFFSLHASKNQATDSLGIFIRSEAKQYFIQQGMQQVSEFTHATPDTMITTDFPVIFQSQLTHIVMQQLFTTQNCELTSYVDSMKIHIPLLTVLGKHYTKDFNSKTICPIT